MQNNKLQLFCIHNNHRLLSPQAPVQYQCGSSDCGLFAIAFATSLVKGENPVSVQYIQHSMRQLLLFCIEKKKKDVFPRQAAKTKREHYLHNRARDIWCCLLMLTVGVQQDDQLLQL